MQLAEFAGAAELSAKCRWRTFFGTADLRAQSAMLGPARADGTDSYVLGEINVSSVFPIPDEAPAEIAHRVADRLSSKL